MPVRAIPEGHHTLVPHLAFQECAKAIEFYKQAFGARENYRMPMPNGKIMHADLSIGDSHVFLMDDMRPDAPAATPGAFMVQIWSPEPDAIFERALQAGATVRMPLQDMFWGDRFGVLVDPFGHTWAIAKHVEDLPTAEIEKRARAEMSK